jgi:hypothetical protein
MFFTRVAAIFAVDAKLFLLPKGASGNDFRRTIFIALLTLFEIARVLVRFDHVANRIVNANHSHWM